jgi:histidinol-phosphate aminotransferase
VNNQNPYLRKELSQFHAYSPGEQPHENEAVIKLNTNENPYPPSPRIETAINEILQKGLLRKYPNYNSRALRLAIAKKYDLDPDQILVTNGSDEALRLLFQAVLAPSDTIVVPDPTYSLYPVLADELMSNIGFLRVPLTTELKFDFDRLKQTKGSLLAFAHPNAPTGILEDKRKLLDLIENFEGIVLSDEAYIDFATAGSSLMSEIKNHPNLLVSRTFSKSYSLAGLRVGYLAGEKSTIQLISKLKDSYNVGMLEQAIALAAFEDEIYFQKNISLVISERIRLTQEIRSLGFYIPESSTNFIFCKPGPGISPENIYLSLKDRNILIRYFSTGLAKDYIRISIGSPPENDRLLEELKRLLK